MTRLNATAGDAPCGVPGSAAPEALAPARQRYLIAFHPGTGGCWRTLATVEDRSICQVLHRLAEVQTEIGVGIYRIYRIRRDGSRLLVFEGLRLTGADIVDTKVRAAARLG